MVEVVEFHGEGACRDAMAMLMVIGTCSAAEY